MTRSVLIVGLMLLVGACQASRQGEGPAVADADTASDAQRRSAVEPGPAPGTVRVRATVRACRQEAASDYRCRLEIREVIAYGAATPVLDAGSDVEVQIPAGEEDDHGARWQADAEVEATLLHAKRPTPDASSMPAWELQAVREE